MTKHGYAHGLAVWARNPSGFAWSDVCPNYTPNSFDDVREWAMQDCRDAGIMGDRLDDAIDHIEAAIQGIMSNNNRLTVKT